MKEVVCNKCKWTLTLDQVRDDTVVFGVRTKGCGCDPDSSSWIGLQPDGRLLKMSGASYTVIVD